MRFVDNDVVCSNEKCLKPIKIGDRFVLVQISLECIKINPPGRFASYPSNRALNDAQLAEQYLVYHQDCYNPPKAPLLILDDFKEGVNHLSGKDQENLYRYLHDTHRCRY